MLVDGLVVRATSRDTVSADATPSGAVGAHRHDEPIVVVGAGGKSGRAIVAADPLSLLSRASEVIRAAGDISMVFVE